MKKAIPNVGDSAPLFKSITSKKQPFNLKKALAKGRNVMMVFYRGHW